MAYKITNVTGVDLRIGQDFLSVGDSFIVEEISGDLSSSIARGHVQKVLLPSGTYTVTNNASSSTYVGGVYLEPGQTTSFNKLPDTGNNAFSSGVLSYTFSASAVASSGTGVSNQDIAFPFTAAYSGAQFLVLSLTQTQIDAGYSLYINGLLQRRAFYQVNTNGVTVPPGLNVIAGDLIDFQYTI